MRRIPLYIALLVCAFWAHAGLAACPPSGYTRDRLVALRAQQYVVASQEARDALALGLLDCLPSPDAELRDKIAYEALSSWMRGKQLEGQTLRQMLERLTAWIDPALEDQPGFLKPFAALILSEVARADRIDPFMSNERRGALVKSACRYLESIRDYRGFDERVGWRHGVAHTADLMVQLAVNTAVDKSELDAMLRSIGTQVAPPGEHFYLYGEGERLAQAVYYVASRHLHDSDDWRAWFNSVTSPAPFPSWDEAFASQAGLAKRHNTAEFLRSLYVYVDANADDETKRRIGKPLADAVKRIG